MSLAKLSSVLSVLICGTLFAGVAQAQARSAAQAAEDEYGVSTATIGQLAHDEWTLFKNQFKGDDNNPSCVRVELGHWFWNLLPVKISPAGLMHMDAEKFSQAVGGAGGGGSAGSGSNYGWCHDQDRIREKIRETIYDRIEEKAEASVGLTDTKDTGSGAGGGSQPAQGPRARGVR